MIWIMWFPKHQEGDKDREDINITFESTMWLSNVSSMDFNGWRQNIKGLVFYS